MQKHCAADTNSSPRICVIGAGPCGLTTVKNLQEQGLTNVCVFEKGAQIGGNWVYDENNEHSSIYETTHIISSRGWSQFEDFHMPWEYPDYPSHVQVLSYFQNYAKHFGLESFIQFNTSVLKANQTIDKKWLIVYENEKGIHEEIFDYLFVANGHHWDPLLPTYPGTFTGEMMHAHAYKKSAQFKNKKVLVVGGGNSGCDIAVEISRQNPASYISLRRGYHIFPKFILGKPADSAFVKLRWLPAWLRQPIIAMTLKVVQGRYSKNKLMKPDCGPLEAHPTINSELMYFIRHGKIKVRPGIERFSDKTVYFTDGTAEEFDTVIFATGYKISFPFFDKQVLDFSEALRVPLYRKMMHPDYENLYFIGLFQPQGCIWPLADFQAKIASRIIAGSLKRPKHLHAKIAKELKRPHYRFKAHTRHAIEVDYHQFRKELSRML
ncbi:MAG: NAD(P)-binding domain-containing protein [Legionella sp.]|jgi:cation diffusion facilitator CzcD-associated flavoprotein CzcO